MEGEFKEGEADLLGFKNRENLENLGVIYPITKNEYNANLANEKSRNEFSIPIKVASISTDRLNWKR